MNYPYRDRSGFTLAELLVASTILVIVMAAVYTSFSVSLRTWRYGATNFEQYQDARVALNIMSRELHSVVRGTGHTFEGDRNNVEFYTLGPPMDVDEGMDARAMWVSYELERGGMGRTKQLVRREAMVRGALPLESLGTGDPELTRVSLGRKQKFTLAENVEDFRISYWWSPEAVQESGLRGTEMTAPVEPIEVNRNRKGAGLPHGVKIVLTMRGDEGRGDELEFATFVAFRGPLTPYDQDKAGGL